jgi:hypothetical protein
VVPAVVRWRDREAAIDAARDRVLRLRGLVRDQQQVVAAAMQVNERLATGPRVMRGRTADLVAADVQRLLQDQARLSRVSVSRLEVLPTPPDSAREAATALSASLTATTDIYGLADLLARLHRSQALMAVEELSVAPNPVLRGNLLQIAMTLRAPWLLEAP